MTGPDLDKAVQANAELCERLLKKPYRTIHGEGISGRDKLLNQYEREREEAAIALTLLSAAPGRKP